jgi:hypothetical protein
MLASVRFSRQSEFWPAKQGYFVPGKPPGLWFLPDKKIR